MCRQCIPIKKNDKQRHGSTESENKDIVSKGHEKILNKT